MPPQRATLLQVAQRAGVSRSTASFVLAGRHVDMRISEDARQRVLRAAQELDYRPNLMARSLRTKVTKTIALVSDTLASDPYAGRAIHGSLAAAVAHGHLLFIGETEGDPVIEEKLISDFLDRQVDAFVYASMFTRYVRVPKLLRGRSGGAAQLPDPGRPAGAARGHPGRGGRRLERRQGRSRRRPPRRASTWSATRPTTSSPAGNGWPASARASARRASRLAGTIDCDWWPDSAYEAVSRGAGRRAATQGADLPQRPGGAGRLPGAARGRPGHPGDVSVLSFDDSDLAAWLRPQLTSISLPHYQLGWQAVELLLGRGRAATDARGARGCRCRSGTGPRSATALIGIRRTPVVSLVP